MLFASFDFLLFVVPVLVIYWLAWKRPRARLAFVTAASYFFYMASSRRPDGSLPPSWMFVGLLVFSTFLDYWASKEIHRQDVALDSANPATRERAKKIRFAFLLLSVVGNLGLLGYFKYTNFLLEAFSDVVQVFGLHWMAPHLAIVLPTGISFYTFQTLSYTIDVWRRRLTPEPSLLRFSTFVVFFPQLVAGPIVRASEFLPQLHVSPKLNASEIEEAVFRILKGLIKKVILADFIAANLTDLVFSAPQDYTSVENLIALYGFTLQIYGDFSGYSDIAIGVALLMGFRLPENFDRPYQARDAGEFWRRWHMTLSTWLRDYLFFPLGGSKKGPLRSYFNLWLTMFLVGIWHGAKWTFVIYACIHGMAMVFNRWNRLRRGSNDWWHQSPGVAIALAVFVGLGWLLAAPVLHLASNAVVAFCGFVALSLLALMFLPPPVGRLWTALHVALTFHFTVLSRVFFKATDTHFAAAMIEKLMVWDGLGVRIGFFRAQIVHTWLAALEEKMPLPPSISPLAWFVGEWLLFIILFLGLAYHFTPRRWVDESLRSIFGRLPGFVWGLIFAITTLLIMKVLNGPRANIYFEF
jgi:D-alanyl-lipoteichoic acid acyltransferase DltB (MBOAT superfamily)